MRWDDVESNRHTRVSPWEIEPSGSVSGSNGLITSGLKRTRIGLPSAKPEFPVPGMSYMMRKYFLASNSFTFRIQNVLSNHCIIEQMGLE